MKFSFDAGHAGFGVTAGKRCPDGSMYEWDFNNAVVKYILSELNSYENVQTLRVDDPTGKTDVPLKSRTNKINAWGSQCHVSVHANAYGTTWNDAHGIETFVYKSNLKEAVSLANKVQSELVKATGLFNRGVKTGNLHMLRESHMTAILCECSFMTNKNEAALLKSDAYRKKVALAIVSGLVAQYGLKKKAVSVPTPSNPIVHPKPQKTQPNKDIHIVQSGESLWAIAKKNSMAVDELKKLNNLNSDVIHVGDQLKLNTNAKVTVQPTSPKVNPIKQVIHKIVKPKAKPVSGKLTYARTLKKGMKGNDVKALQNALNKLNFKCGTADGDFGNKTLNAVTRFQKVYLPNEVDGIAGKHTVDKINSLLK